MISDTIDFVVKASPEDVLKAVSDPNNLPKLWKYLKEVSAESPTSYVAKFKVFMTFTFKMNVRVLKDTVIHEGVTDRPKAFFGFTVGVTSNKASSGFTRVIVTGDYKGPLKSLARSPMMGFLEHFRDSLIDLLAQERGSKVVVMKPSELLNRLKSDSADSRV